jgi:hypothetical protein
LWYILILLIVIYVLGFEWLIYLFAGGLLAIPYIFVFWLYLASFFYVNKKSYWMKWAQIFIFFIEFTYVIKNLWEYIQTYLLGEDNYNFWSLYFCILIALTSFLRLLWINETNRKGVRIALFCFLIYLLIAILSYKNLLPWWFENVPYYS